MTRPRNTRPRLATIALSDGLWIALSPAACNDALDTDVIRTAPTIVAGEIRIDLQRFPNPAALSIQPGEDPLAAFDAALGIAAS